MAAVKIIIRRRQRDTGLGSDGSVRLFEFWWDGVSRSDSGGLRTGHQQFNSDFVGTFWQREYTAPFTNYNDNGIGVGSRLFGLGETVESDAWLRQWIKAAAHDAGIHGDESRLQVFSHTIDEISAGASLPDAGTTVNPLATTDGVRDLIGTDPWKAFAAGLGITTTMLAVGGIAFLVLTLRR
jgi:hypothetical protein